MEYAGDYQLYTPIKTYKEELWTEPKEFLKCDKCNGEFFSNKFLGGVATNFFKCSFCEHEMDLRKGRL